MEKGAFLGRISFVTCKKNMKGGVVKNFFLRLSAQAFGFE